MPFIGKTNLGNNFYPKLVEIASELQMKPEDILAIMVSESGINNNIYEGKFKGGGLIGFMPDTQKGLGFKGEWNDFLELSGEQQLTYVKRYIQDKIRYNGKPFTSAAQYYVANFFPIALKLPGIQQGNPSTVFIEENPETVKDPKTGRIWSKKYWDIGIKSPPGLETSAYRENKLFHGSVQGAITYGDMMRQVDKNKQSPIYKKAIQNMAITANYHADTSQDNRLVSSPMKTEKHTSWLSDLLTNIENFLSRFAKNDHNQFLISLGSSTNQTDTLEYARILSTALQEYLKAKTNICKDQNNIEIECQAHGDKKQLFNAIKELSTNLSEVFKIATKKNIDTFALVVADAKSDFASLTIKEAEINYRKFHLRIKQ